MHTTIKRSLTITAMLFVAAICGLTFGQSTRSTSTDAACAMASEPKVIAVKFHADWCGFCKTMGPVFEEMQAKFDQEPVLYVTLDQTRDFDRKQSMYLTHAMGLDGVWEENGGKTGFVLLIDAGTRKVVQKLSHEQNLKQMGAALQEAVQKASKADAPAKPARPGRPEHPEHPK